MSIFCNLKEKQLKQLSTITKFRVCSNFKIGSKLEQKKKSVMNVSCLLIYITNHVKTTDRKKISLYCKFLLLPRIWIYRKSHMLTNNGICNGFRALWRMIFGEKMAWKSESEAVARRCSSKYVFLMFHKFHRKAPSGLQAY